MNVAAEAQGSRAYMVQGKQQLKFERNPELGTDLTATRRDERTKNQGNPGELKALGPVSRKILSLEMDLSSLITLATIVFAMLKIA